MSGNRAITAAINRRTNTPQPMKQQQQQPQSKQNFNQAPMRQQQQQQQQQVAPPKLSVSDAIALITIRLGRVETFINNLPPLDQLEHYSSNTQPEQNENMKIVDDAVFKSICSRLDKLEHSKPASVATTIVNTSSNDEIQELKTDNISLREEIIELKNLLLQLQNYTMTTNQKLCDIIFSNENDEKNISDELSKILSSSNNENDIEIESSGLEEYLSASLNGIIISEVNEHENICNETQNLNINI
jgi:uncharacterized protein YdcH (DUF465 family)